jgi:hypothetical protein
MEQQSPDTNLNQDWQSLLHRQVGIVVHSAHPTTSAFIHLRSLPPPDNTSNHSQDQAQVQI